MAGMQGHQYPLLALIHITESAGSYRLSPEAFAAGADRKGPANATSLAWSCLQVGQDGRFQAVIDLRSNKLVFDDGRLNAACKSCGKFWKWTFLPL